MSKKIEQNHFEGMMVKSLLKNTATATAWALFVLVQTGAITAQAFLSPSLYADFPNVGSSLLEPTQSSKKKPKFKEITIRQSLRRLEKYGFVERKESKYFLTARGRKFAEYVAGMKKSKNKTWDKKYRVVIFDIPEKKRDVRDWLRQELKLLDYKKLQNSVFIGKHPLPDCVIKRIKQEKINSCVNYLLVDKVYKNIL